MLEGLTGRVKESPLLWALGAFFLLAGIGLIVLAHEIETRQPLASELSRDLGIALCISVFIAALIEIGLAKQMFEKGLNAIMNQTVPPEVWSEVRQHVISQPVYRHRFSITMDIALSNDEYVSTTTLEYKLQSLRDVLKHRVHHRIDKHRALKNYIGSRYKFVKIDDQPINDLQSYISADHLSVDFDIQFSPRRKEAKVAVQFLEYIDPTDTINWWMNTSTETVLVKVSAPVKFEADIEAHHPAPRGLLTGDLASGWTFGGVMLPGQGLEIRLVLPAIAAAIPASASA